MEGWIAFVVLSVAAAVVVVYSLSVSVSGWAMVPMVFVNVLLRPFPGESRVLGVSLCCTVSASPISGSLRGSAC